MKIGMLFPGYGSQYVGMGKEFYDESRIMQEYFEQASHCLEINFTKLCFAASDAELAKMQHAYTALFLMSSSIAAILKDAGITPDVVAGYNVGQYAAIHAINGLSFADGLYLLSKLSLFSQELFDKQQLTVLRVKGCSLEELNAVLKQHDPALIGIASHEMPNQYIISGDAEAAIVCMQALKELDKVKVEELPIQFGLHAPIMTPAIEQFEVYFEKVDFKDVQVPLIANRTAQVIQAADELKQEIIHYTKNPLLWSQTMQNLHDCDIILAIGPSVMNIDMFSRLFPNKQILAIQKPADVEAAKQLIAEMNQPAQEPNTEETIGS